MSVHKIKKGPYYYADYYDFNGVRRRISLQTENKQVALLKYQEFIRRRNAIKERFSNHYHVASVQRQTALPYVRGKIA